MAKSADAFRTISEVAEWLETPAHVLRFWESKFSQVKPVKRAGGRRYYRPADMQLLGGIKKLLHEDGMTIKGVQKVLREQGVRHVAELSQPLDEVTEAEAVELAQDVPIEDDPETGQVLSFSREKAAEEMPAAPEPVTEPVAEAEAPAARDRKPTPEPHFAPDEPPETAPEPESVAEADPEPDAGPEAGSADETQTGDTVPVMPSFSHRHVPDEEREAEAETAEAETEEPTPAPAIDLSALPADPGDDIAAEPGALSALAGFSGPIDDDLARRLRGCAEKLASLSPSRGA